MTEQERSAAAEIVGSWFWQAAEGHNYRWTHAVRSITRFYESAPMEADQLKLVIEYLRTMENITSFELNQKKFEPGGSWSAKDAWFQTSPGDKWEGTQSTKVRIYQTLIETDASESGDGPYQVEDGCRYKVSHTFYWDVSELPELTASSSGVSYTLQGVTRDRETGLFSCVVEKRERVEQDIALYGSVQTIFEHRQEAEYLGVKAGDLAGKGLQASAGGGVLVERHLTKNEDCTTDVRNVVTTEESIPDSVKEWRKTLRGGTVSVTDRNQVSPLTGSGMAVGEMQRSEKTPGGLYNNTTVTKTTDAAGRIAASCSKTIFEHEHQETENVESEPSADDVISAADGVIHSFTHRETEEGTWDVITGTRTEFGVSDSVKEWRKTLRGGTVSVTDRNQVSPLTGSGMGVGEVQRSEKTPGGLYNNTTVTKTTDAAGRIAAACVKAGGGLMHQHQTVDNVVSESVSSASSADQNYQHQIQVRQNEEGTWNVERTVTKWEPAEESESWSDLNYHYIHKVYINQLEPLVPSSGDVVSCSFTINSHGSYDGSWTVRNGVTASGSTLQWSFGPQQCKAKIHYFNKKGKLCHREVSGMVYRCFGKASHVADHIYGSQSGTGGVGDNMPAVGWHTTMSMHGTVNAEGVKYTGITIGEEQEEESGGSSQSQS